MPKLALHDIAPYATDRQFLRLELQEIRYFDFEGPRRALYDDKEPDTPTDFARDFYLGKEVPKQIPTPLACVHTVLTVNKGKQLVIGLRRGDFGTDFYKNRLSVGFEEQMSPGDVDLFGTIRRGLREEVGIQAVDEHRIKLLHIGLEASFFSVALIAVAHLDCDAKELHESIQLKAADHEWDALFVPNDTDNLLRLLKNPSPKWSELSPTHFLTFTPRSEYLWHGTSRARLFSFLALKEGIDRLGRLAHLTSKG